MMTYQILQWIAVQLRERETHWSRESLLSSVPAVKSRETFQWLRSCRWLGLGAEQVVGVLCPYLPGGVRGWLPPPRPTSHRRPRRSWWTLSRCRPRLTATTTLWLGATTRPPGRSCWTISIVVCWPRVSMELSHGDPRALREGGWGGEDWDRRPPRPPIDRRQIITGWHFLCLTWSSPDQRVRSTIPPDTLSTVWSGLASRAPANVSSAALPLRLTRSLRLYRPFSPPTCPSPPLPWWGWSPPSSSLSPPPCSPPRSPPAVRAVSSHWATPTLPPRRSSQPSSTDFSMWLPTRTSRQASPTCPARSCPWRTSPDSMSPHQTVQWLPGQNLPRDCRLELSWSLRACPGSQIGNWKRNTFLLTGRL